MEVLIVASKAKDKKDIKEATIKDFRPFFIILWIMSPQESTFPLSIHT